MYRPIHPHFGWVKPVLNRLTYHQMGKNNKEQNIYIYIVSFALEMGVTCVNLYRTELSTHPF